MTLNDAVSWVTIISFAGCVARFFIVKPAQKLITNLCDEIRELREFLQRLETKVDAENRTFDTRITRIDESSKSAHHRIDCIERRVENLEHVV